MFEIVVLSFCNKIMIPILDVVVEGIILPLISLVVFFMQIGVDAANYVELNENIIFTLIVFFCVSFYFALIIVMKFGAPHCLQEVLPHPEIPLRTIPWKKEHRQETCVICLECYHKKKKRKTLAFLCDHAFCRGCLTLWLRENKTCPLCRSFVQPLQN